MPMISPHWRSTHLVKQGLVVLMVAYIHTEGCISLQAGLSTDVDDSLHAQRRVHFSSTCSQLFSIVSQKSFFMGEFTLKFTVHSCLWHEINIVKREIRIVRKAARLTRTELPVRYHELGDGKGRQKFKKNERKRATERHRISRKRKEWRHTYIASFVLTGSSTRDMNFVPE